MGIISAFLNCELGRIGLFSGPLPCKTIYLKPCSLSCIPFYIGIEQIALGGEGGGRVFLETENVLKIEISGLAHDKEFRKSSSSEKAIYTLQNER
jgi:hypothetical protein